jgi:hypothetical protein
MKSDAELWAEVHRQFAYHRKKHDPDAQSAMDRVAMKCLGASKRRSFNPTNCTISETTLTSAQLAELLIYHTRSNPRRMDGPIVVLRIDGRSLAIDGNSRANAWKAGQYAGPFTAIVVEPR